jgi:alkyl sulfatase BDS1-like metallo-beta-lactamase superfamily hydrolase
MFLQAQDEDSLIAQQESSFLPFGDSTDFRNAMKGFIATREDPEIRTSDGRLAYDLSKFDFIRGPAPKSVHPSLWRQSHLNTLHGLFKVTEGIYQVRGFDLANMSFIATDEGWIIVDPLTTQETASAALDLVTEHLGQRDIKAVIITHNHIDHFGGIRGVTNEEDVRNGVVEIIAPEGFYENALSENVLAGNAMKRRASYMYGMFLPADSTGLVGSGLGQSTSGGTYGIIRPSITISSTGQELTIDGVKLVFQFTPGAEAQSEFMFYMPDLRAFCQAEEINHTLHNLYTLRGAPVRNGLKWAKYVDESIRLFGDSVRVSFGSHHWPTWGQQEILDFWKGQRDTYRYIHDEALALANRGYTMNEVAELIRLPEELDRKFANRGYYGTVSHNAKAQYQMYYGWFDGNPANLNPLPPEEMARKVVDYMGGPESVLDKVRTDLSKKEYRWAATVLNYLVFQNPDNQEARDLLAKVYEHLGYAAESGPWRNFYLSGASELRYGLSNTIKRIMSVPVSRDVLTGMSLETFYDYMSVRLDREKAKGKEYVFNLIFPDIEEEISLHLQNQVLHNRPGQIAENADATITLDKAVFNQIITGEADARAKLLSGEVTIEGNMPAYADFQQMMAAPFNALFQIIEP